MRERGKVQLGVAETTKKLVELDLRESLGPTPPDIESPSGYSGVASQDSEIAGLREQLARQQALRRDLERELAESRSRQRELERRLNGIERTFKYRLGETLVAARSFKGMLAMPGRFWRMWSDWLEKKRLDRMRPDAGPETRFAEQLCFVGDLIDVHRAEGLAAARLAGAALPNARPREKARALVELAHEALGDAPGPAVEVAIEAAALNPAEPRLKALAFRLFDLGQVTAAARVLAAGRDLEFHPGDLPRRQSIGAFSAWRKGVDLGKPHTGPARSGGVLLVEGLGEARGGPRRRTGALAADYGARGLDVCMALSGLATAPQDVRVCTLPPPLASLHALDVLAEERAAALESLIAAEDIGLIHAGSDLVSALAAAKAARRTGCRLVLDIDALAAIRRQRGPAWDASEGFDICTSLLREAFTAADLIIARTPALGQAMARLTGRAPDLVLPDLATPARGARAHAIPGLEPTDQVILLPRFSEAEPRSLAVVEALAEVARTVPKVRLVPVGAGRDLGPLRQRAHDLGVKDRLIVAEAARLPIEDLVARAQVLLFDDAETGVSGLAAPVGLAEARKLGVPVVAVNGSWAEGLISDRDAWLVDPRTPGQLAEHLAAALRAGSSSPKLKRAAERGEEDAVAHREALGQSLSRLGF